MDLHEKYENVDSKESFLEFVEALIEDKIDEDKKEELNPSSPYDSGANGWENNTIAMFLEAASAGSTESEELELSWKGFATFLYKGKVYE